MARLKRVPLTDMALLEGEPFYFGETLQVESNLIDDEPEIEKIMETSFEMQLATAICLNNGSGEIWAVNNDCKTLSETASKLFLSVRIICDNCEVPKAIGVSGMSAKVEKVFLKLKACGKINPYLAIGGLSYEEDIAGDYLFEISDVTKLSEAEMDDFKKDEFVSYKMKSKHFINKPIKINVSAINLYDIVSDKVINQFLNLSEKSYLLILYFVNGEEKFHTKFLIIT